MSIIDHPAQRLGNPGFPFRLSVDDSHDGEGARFKSKSSNYLLQPIAVKQRNQYSSSLLQQAPITPIFAHFPTELLLLTESCLQGGR